MLRITLATITAFFLISSDPVKAEKPSQTEEGIYQTGFGVHTYLLDGELSDESATTLSGFSGFNWSGRRIVGVRLSYAKYELTRTIGNFRVDNDTKTIISITPLIRWRFRAQAKLQPFLDAGIGITDQYAGVGGFKLAFTFGLGMQYKVKEHLGTIHRKSRNWMEPRRDVYRRLGQGHFNK